MASDSILGPVAGLRGLCRMTPERALRGHRLGRFLTGMRDPARRAAFAADPEASMAAADLTGHERTLVRNRDFDGMLDYGVSNVAVGKALPALGHTLVDRGAKGRGQSAAEFISERRARNEGYPWHF